MNIGTKHCQPNLAAGPPSRPADPTVGAQFGTLSPASPLSLPDRFDSGFLRQLQFGRSAVRFSLAL
jgi:hypothetical protein